MPRLSRLLALAAVVGLPIATAVALTKSYQPPVVGSTQKDYDAMPPLKVHQTSVPQDSLIHEASPAQQMCLVFGIERKCMKIDNPDKVLSAYVAPRPTRTPFTLFEEVEAHTDSEIVYGRHFPEIHCSVKLSTACEGRKQLVFFSVSANAPGILQVFPKFFFPVIRAVIVDRLDEDLHNTYMESFFKLPEQPK